MKITIILVNQLFEFFFSFKESEKLLFVLAEVKLFFPVLHFSPPTQLVKGCKSEKWESQRWFWYPCGPGSRWAILLYCASPTHMLTSLSSLAASKATASSFFLLLHLFTFRPYSTPTLILNFTFVHVFSSPCCTSISLPNLNFPPGSLKNLSLSSFPLIVFLVLLSAPKAVPHLPPYLTCCWLALALLWVSLSTIPPSCSICFVLPFQPSDLVQDIMGVSCGGYHCFLWQACLWTSVFVSPHRILFNMRN